MNEGVDQCLLGLDLVEVDGFADALPQAFQQCLAGRLSLGLLQCGNELVLSVAEFVGLDREGLDAGAEPVEVELALFEGEHVPVHRLLGAAKFGLDDVEFGVVVVAVAGELGGGVSDGLLDEVGLFEGEEQHLQQGQVELVGGQAVGGAGAGAVARPGEAGVVAVAGELAGCGGADEAFVAPAAVELAGQQVVARVAGAFGLVFAPFGEEFLYRVE